LWTLYSIWGYPEFVISIVLRGVFLARKEDADWFLLPSGGAAQGMSEAGIAKELVNIMNEMFEIGDNF
jgi:hypothetical protein